MLLEDRHRFAGDPFAPRQEGARQAGHVGGALAQRRDRHGDDVDPIEEIAAKRARVGARRRDHARVERHAGVSAEAREALLLHRPEKLRLQRRRERGDLVEVDRAAAGHLQLPELARGGVGERPLLVAEQLALEQLGGDAGAFDVDERLVAARAAGVDGAGQEVLAAAGLAEEEDGDVVVEDLLEGVEERAHRRVASADDATKSFCGGHCAALPPRR